jgi:four helix bundle protein
MNREKWAFENLEVWRLFLIQNKILCSSLLPNQKTDWDLIRQMRRAMVSVGLNIAEGYSRKHKKEKIQFLNISKASLSEVKACLLIMESLTTYENDLPIITSLLSQLALLDVKILHLMRYFENKR